MASESSSADFSETVDVSFHSIAYLLTVSTINGETLCLEVEQKSDASRWRGDFTARYIEDITAKTGNFKKFPVFVKMLLSAVKHASDSVFMDLLTYQDLEVLKSRKANPAAASQGPPPRNPTVAPNNKRYLILTYAAEFDRVHYPLPLLYEEHPDPQHLKSIIGRLRGEVDGLTQQLQQQQQQLATAGAAHAREMARDLKMVQRERDLLLTRVESLDAELQRERGLHRRELRKKAKDVQEAFEEAAHSREQTRELKLQVRQLMEELDASSRYMTSADRIRSAYGRQPGPRPRPTVPSGARYPNGTRYDPLPRSRETSRGRETSSRERERLAAQPRYPPSRPSSAPSARSGPRFNPTEYVRAKRERDRVLLERARSSPGSSRNLTPQRSAASTPPRAHSPVSSRPHSAERGGGVYGSRGGGYSPSSRGGYSPSSSRPGSGLDRDRATRPDRLRAGAGTTTAPDRPPPVDPLALPKSRAGSPSSSGSRRPAWNAGSDSWSKFPGGRANGRPESAGRSTSPGRALQEVKNRLSSYMSSRNTADDPPATLPSIHQPPGPHQEPQGTVPAASSHSRTSQPGRPPQLFDDASTEIADIDTRLHALQNFLKMAKSSGRAAAS